MGRGARAPSTAKGEDAFGWNRLRYTQTVQESKALNDLRVPFMVMSASGMCEAGRILHHLKNGIEDPRNLMLITGYQAENTLGRKLVERLPEVNIFGEPMRVRARGGLDRLAERPCGPAGAAGLDGSPSPPTLKKVFLVHGELAAHDGAEGEDRRALQAGGGLSQARRPVRGELALFTAHPRFRAIEFRETVPDTASQTA